jgi:glycosyltransferase involved in cell wall biosynthesis
MHQPIRVLSVGHSYVVAMNRAILRELAKDPRFEVTVGAPRYFKGSLRGIELEPEPEGSKIHLVPLRAHWTHQMHLFAYDHFDLKKLFKNDFDCAHFWEEPYIFSGYQLGRMAKKRKLPFLFRTAQSLVKNYIFPFSYFEKATLHASQRWVAGGSLVYQAMLEKGWKKPGQVITLAVDTKAFLPFDDIQKKKGRDQLKLKAPVLGYLGRLSEEKGLDLLMEVLTDIKEKSWSFLAMGSGPYEFKIKQWVRKENLQDRVTIKLVPHQNVPQVLPICDLLLCPSQTRHFWKEQFGRMIVEAFASGVPVIGSDSGEIPRVIGEAGLVLPEADRGAWKKAIIEFLENPETYMAYKPLALQRVEQYSAATIAESYKTVYTELAGPV